MRQSRTPWRSAFGSVEPMPARLLSVNVVHALIPDRLGDLDRTAIDKRPVAGRVQVQRLGVAGDRQYDERHHGGPDQAIYAYAREDTEWWERELGRQLAPGQFGENLTTVGLDITGALIGEVWRIGDVGLDVRGPRIPCRTFQGWLGEKQWVKRFTLRGATGAYLRVRREGTVASGDLIEVVSRPAHDVTLGDMFRALMGDREHLARLLQVPDLSEAALARIRQLRRPSPVDGRARSAG